MLAGLFMAKSICKILIANRGEIAVRITRSCREMGIKTVAVFSEADRKSLHVAMADEAYLLGPAPSAQSYLVVDKLIEVAKNSGADAVHPGYGFLSEKDFFSTACEKAGLVFIGPKPKAIAAMGDKITARTLAQKAKVPMVPGTLEPVSDLKKIAKLATEFGYPILLKAAAGGGGKGMRVVHEDKELASAYDMAASEAKNAFVDDRLYVEKLIEKPRHVEIQIIRDAHDQGFFLLERECSMQRRHQKVIEEAPCPYLKDDVRRKMAEASLRLAEAVDYLGVGTLEYLVDDKQDFYFLEMNTRLQVEHTVTEMITGLDLVELQIRVAQGEKLALKQENICPNGHAIQCRIYAEDPENNFMPSPGKIEFFEPAEGPGIRHDTGVYDGAEISMFYDPMIAKLVAHATTRDRAIKKMQRALREYRISGPAHNIGFLQTLLATPEFCQARGHTQFIDQHPELTQGKLAGLPMEVVLGVAAWDRVQKLKAGTVDLAKAGGQSADAMTIWAKEGLAESLGKRCWQ